MISFFSTSKQEQKYFEDKLSGVSCEKIFIDSILNNSHLPLRNDFTIISVFVDSLVDKATLDHFPNLKLIATRSTGYDHIDLAECAKRSIVVVNVPTYGENTVAEHAFGLLLALSKRIYEGYNQLRMQGDFDPSKLLGFDLYGKTLGVVGTGNIGKHAIKIGNGFSMKVICYDAFPKKELQSLLGFEYRDTLEQLLEESDVVTLHLPYMKATHHLINSENILHMKQGAVLINTSRGQIVETEALVRALGSGHLYGAGLDVVEEEGVMKNELGLLIENQEKEHNIKTVLSNHILIDMPNVIMTPHSAFNTREALQRIMDTTAQNITTFIAGTPINVVHA
jgi:D-lactate dehydrogenase